jgi:hypothetical protein
VAERLRMLAGPRELHLIGEGGRLALTRERIGDAIELLVALLDIADREPDMEEPDLEDGFVLSPRALSMAGPGCSVSDPGGCEHDGREIEDGY